MIRNALCWICLACCLQACLRVDTKLKLVNASRKPVLVFYTTDNHRATEYHQINGLPDYNPFHEFQKADTTRGYQAGLMRDNPNYIAPGATISARLGQGSWEGHIGKGRLRVYRFKPETVLHNDWNSLRKGQKWDKVYAFTLEQVESQNWVVRLQ